MSNRIEPLTPAQLPAGLEPVLDLARETMGFVPNDLLTMARWPALLEAMAGLVGAVWSPGQVGMPLKRLVGLAASLGGGCAYCVAHNAHGALRDGEGAPRVAGLADAERSELYTPAERAALRVALRAGQAPNAVSDEDFRELEAHFDSAEVLEIVGVIALFGFLNRWNATLATRLEPAPAAVAERLLGPGGWRAGRHAP